MHDVIRLKQVQHVKSEKKILQVTEHKFDKHSIVFFSGNPAPLPNLISLELKGQYQPIPPVPLHWWWRAIFLPQKSSKVLSVNNFGFLCRDYQRFLLPENILLGRDGWMNSHI